MTIREFLPRPQAPIAGPNPATSEFYDFLIRLSDSIGDGVATETIQALIDRLESLENQEPARLQGLVSVEVSGTLANGLAQVALQNDAASPDPFYYYGTDTDAAKGWHPTSDTVDAEDGIQKTVTPEGVAMLSPVGNLASVHGLTTVGFSLRIDDGDWQTRVFNVAGDASLSDDGSAITITVESYPPELGYGGV